MTTLRNLVFSIILGISAVASGSTVYVDCDATAGLDDGTSWADAYTDLQDALNSASANDEIWVAEGTYYPGASRSDSFELPGDVCIYGGFYGTEEYVFQRDFRNNETILSGNIDDDTIIENDCYCVVLVENAETEIDGFTITNGYTSTGMGGCMRIIDTSDDTNVSNCIIQNGYATSGGGIYIENAAIVLISCILRDNTAISDDYCYGGALYGIITGASGHYMSDCLFYNNSCHTGATSIFDQNGQPNPLGTGGAVYDEGIAAFNCTFSANSAEDFGSFYGHSMNNCISWDNDSTFEVENHYRQVSARTGYCCIEGELTDCTDGYTPHCELCHQTISTNPSFVDAANGDYSLNSNSPCINTGQNIPNSAYTQKLYDLAGNNRCVLEITSHGDEDHIGNPHTKYDHIHNLCPYVIDMGCYEYQNGNTEKSWLKLKAISDTGPSDSDNITNLDNSSTKTLQFELDNTLSSNTYTLEADGTEISNAVYGDSSVITITTDGIDDIEDGWTTIKCIMHSGVNNYTMAECLIYIDTEAPEFTGFSVNKGNAYRSNIAFLDFDFSEDVYLAATATGPLQIHEYTTSPDWTEVTLATTPDYTIVDNTLSCDIWSSGHQTVLDDQQYVATLVRDEITDIAGNTLALPSQAELNSCKFYRFCGDANCDLAIGLDDFIAVSAPNMGWTGAWDSFEPGDYDLNGTINLDDFILMRQKYGFTFTNGLTQNAPTWPAN